MAEGFENNDWQEAFKYIPPKETPKMAKKRRLRVCAEAYLLEKELENKPENDSAGENR